MIQLPKLQNLVLRHDYFMGDCNDRSGNGNDGVLTGCRFEKRPNQHLRWGIGTDKVIVPNDPSLQPSNLTIVAYTDEGFIASVAADRFVSKRDASGNEYDFSLAWSNYLALRIGVIDSWYEGIYDGAKSLAVTLNSGEIPIFYKDGVHFGDGHNILNTSPVANDIRIGSYYLDTSTIFLNSPLKGILIYNTALTATEIAQVHAWAMAQHGVSKPATIKADSDDATYSSISNYHLEGAPISIVARGGAIGQYLENTPFQFGDTTGRYKVSTDTVHGVPNTKVIECTTAGHICVPSTQAYGEWEYDVYFGTGNQTFGLIGTTMRAQGDGINNGYAIYANNTDSTIRMAKFVNGGLSSYIGDAVSISQTTWHKVKVTRTSAGLFTLYLDGIEKASGTDTTYTASQYASFYRTGGKIANLIFKPLA